MVGIRLGVFGGTFDPPHTGHLLLAERAREELALERVLWVPAGDPWRKDDRQVTPAEQRSAMVQLAIAGNVAFELCTVEVERAGSSYSVDTLTELHSQYRDVGIYLLLGLDALLDLPNWHDPARLLALATLAVATRGGERIEPQELDRRLPGLAAQVVWLEMPRIDLSGTELRQRAAAGRGLRYAVPAAVDAYIREQRLYQQA